MTQAFPRIAVVVPSYRVTRHILPLLARIGPEVWRVFVVDDACPDRSGDHVAAGCSDPRVVVLRNPVNLGVGGAVLAGYQAAAAAGADVIVKLDGDGQMDPALVPAFVAPILAGEADYTKGNRFFDLARIGRMPPARIFGNAALSFMTKLSSGYWDVFDPTNGYTAIDARVAALLPSDRISRRYFFETDMLFRLNTFRAVVLDIPMDAHYGDEVSGLKISRILGEFLFKHARNFCKRIFYNYYLRDFSAASLELAAGLGLSAFGVAFGAYHWWESAAAGTATPVGTVMLSVLPVLVGLQLLLAFLSQDVANVPRLPIGRRLRPQADAQRATDAAIRDAAAPSP